MLMLLAMLRLPRVIEITGLGRSSIYKLMDEGSFPRPRRLTSAAVGWREDDVREWCDARPVAHATAD